MTIDINVLTILITIILVVFFLIIKNRVIISKKIKLLDYPDKTRKNHKKPTSLINGLLIYLLLSFFFISDIIIMNSFSLKINLIFLLLINIFYFIGYLDDLKNLSPSTKTFLIIFTLLILLPLEENFIIKELLFENFTDKKILLKQSSLFITIFFIYIFYNLLNFSDGINGVAISLSIYFILILAIERTYLNNIELFLIIGLLVCLTLNLKNMSFLGNSGISVLSIVISIIYIHDYNISKNLLADEIFIIFFLPGIDMTRLVIERVVNHKKIYDADLNHFHHLLKKIISEKYIFLAYIVCAVIPYLISMIINNLIFVVLINLLIYIFLVLKLIKISK